jgi:hypothetical protein
MKKLLAAALRAAALSHLAFTGTASAQQEGLVNVFISSDVAVQVPVSVAANVCDVTVAVLVSQINDDAAQCDADAESDATFAGSNRGPGVQSGLINLDLTDVAVQVPVSVAASICDVNVGVLVQDLLDDAATCRADAISITNVT